MRTIDVELAANAYPVYLGRGLLGESQLWGRHLGAGHVLVVSNETVAPLYIDTLRRALGGRRHELLVLPDGERFKTVETWSGIIDRLVGFQARRDASLVALGGGVVGDITGFAAACYMRGIRFIQAPTTLLAQVDASVGGKTGVNHPKGKNLIGAFHQPAAVFIDPDTLDTLPAREFDAGLAEVVKYGAIIDSSFFEWLEEHASAIADRDPAAVDHLIHSSVSGKAQIVAQDEKESGLRALLNFGHSFGHALESATSYERFLHGEAVAIGMAVAAELSEARGLCAPGSAGRLATLLHDCGLPTRIPVDVPVGELVKAMELDKKAVASGLRLILLEALGRARVDAGSTEEEIVAAMRANQRRPATEAEEQVQ